MYLALAGLGEKTSKVNTAERRSFFIAGILRK